MFATAAADSTATDWPTLIGVLLAAAIGGGLGSWGTYIATKNASSLEEKRRRTARGEQAAEALDRQIVQARHLYPWSYGPQTGPTDAEITPIIDEIRINAAFLPQPAARHAFNRFADVILNWHGIATTSSTTAHTILLVAGEEARSVAGAVIRAEEEMPECPMIDGYYATLEHFWENLEGC